MVFRELEQDRNHRQLDVIERGTISTQAVLDDQPVWPAEERREDSERRQRGLPPIGTLDPADWVVPIEKVHLSLPTRTSLQRISSDLVGGAVETEGGFDYRAFGLKLGFEFDDKSLLARRMAARFCLTTLDSRPLSNATVPIFWGLRPETEIIEKTIHFGDIGVDLGKLLPKFLPPVFVAKTSVSLDRTVMRVPIQSQGRGTPQADWRFAVPKLVIASEPSGIVQAVRGSTLSVAANFRLEVHRHWVGGVVHRFYCTIRTLAVYRQERDMLVLRNPGEFLEQEEENALVAQSKVRDVDSAVRVFMGDTYVVHQDVLKPPRDQAKNVQPPSIPNHDASPDERPGASQRPRWEDVGSIVFFVIIGLLIVLEMLLMTIL